MTKTRASSYALEVLFFLICILCSILFSFLTKSSSFASLSLNNRPAFTHVKALFEATTEPSRFLKNYITGIANVCTLQYLSKIPLQSTKTRLIWALQLFKGSTVITNTSSTSLTYSYFEDTGSQSSRAWTWLAYTEEKAQEYLPFFVYLFQRSCHGLRSFFHYGISFLWLFIVYYIYRNPK